MEDFNYAHNDTASGERESATAKFNRAKLPEEIQKLRESAFARGIPTADDETIGFLKNLVLAVKPKNILELGTATGISGAVMLRAGEAKLTTIERDEKFYNEALINFQNLGLNQRVKALFGDAGKIIRTLEGGYDFIFLDCAKVQYVKYLFDLKRLLKKGGVLVADDVLLYGWLTGQAPVPQKRKMLYMHLKEYVDAVTCDKELSTSILNIGDGIALSIKL